VNNQHHVPTQAKIGVQKLNGQGWNVQLLIGQIKDARLARTTSAR
jgi:hypothetical protein